jgi:hypothetical protein
MQAFLALVRAGLWEQDVRLLSLETIDYQHVLELAEEQSVVGLVTAGVDYIVDVKAPQNVSLQFVGETLQLEQRNKALNTFVAKLIDRLRKEDVYCLLVKGQGVAQCYEKPLWRASGDIDLLLSDDNYKRAKKVLIPLASKVANEDEITMHQALVINGFDVELHGKMPFVISKRVDDGIDEVLNDLFCRGNIRSWDCNRTHIYLPSPDNDVILVFTHFLHHFFIEGVGLRQICDWCRLLWTYRESINHALLESRIKRMGLISEWKVFASLSVDALGMPIEAMPFYDVRFKDKGEKVLRRVLKSGNFGHNNDLSYRTRYKGLPYKLVAAWRRFVDFASLMPVFPMDTPKFYFNYMFNKAKNLQRK